MKRGFVWFTWLALLSFSSWAAPCPYLIVYNETDLSVDVDVLCQTAEEINKRHGIQTVVYIDGGNYATKDDWFGHLDKIEFTLTTAEGADVRRTSGYNDIVLLLEAAPASRFAAVAYGANVQELHSNSKWTAISNELETNIKNASGNATQAFNTSMQVVGAPAEMGIGTKILLGFLAIMALAVVVVVVRAVIGKKRKAKELAQARLKRVEALWGTTGNLVTASDALLGGNTIADTELYKLWVLYYGDRQATQHQEVLKLIVTAQQVYQKAFAVFEQLSSVYSDNIGRISDSDLKGLEALYLTLRGTEPLTTEEINALLDPVRLPDEPEPQQSELLSQVNQILVKLSSDSIYNAPVESVGLNTANARGVLGYISTIKQHIAVLAEAMNRILPLREKVERDFKLFSWDAVGLPQLSADTIVNYFINALTETDKLLTSHQYFACDDHLNALAALLEPGYWNQAIKATEQNVRQAEAIRQTGILFGLAEHTLKETINYQNQIITKLSQGMPPQEILALTKEMLVASQKTLETMRQRERIKITFAQEYQRIEQMVREFKIDNQPQARQLQQLVAPYGSEEQGKVLQKLGQVPDESKSLNQLARARQLFESSEQPYEAAWRMMMDVREDYDIEDLVALGMQEYEKLKKLEEIAQEKLAELTKRFEQMRRTYGYHFSDSDENAITSGLEQVSSELARKQIYRAHELLNRLAKLIDDAENEARKRKTEQDERDRRKAQSRTVIFGPGSFGGGSMWGGGSSRWGGSKSGGGGFSGGGRSSGGFGGGGRSGGFGGGGRR